MSIVKNVGRLAQLSVRHVSNSSAARSAQKMEVAEGYKNLKKIQEKFQKNDGKPIHLKNGATDAALYYLTMGSCAVGLGFVFKLFYDLS